MKENQSTEKATDSQNAEYIILCEGRGDYLTGLGAGGEIKGGSSTDAIRYTAAVAQEMAKYLGRGFSVEPGTTQKLNWDYYAKSPKTGRIAEVSDEGCGYWASIPAEMTIGEVIASFTEGYDFGDFAGEIKCFAAIKVDGEEVEFKHFTLDNSERPKFRATIIEQGNGLPSLGEICYDPYTDTVYTVVAWDGRDHIRTNGPGQGNSVNVLLEERGSASDTTEEEWETIGNNNYRVYVEEEAE